VNATRDGGGDVIDDVTTAAVKPTRKFYSSYFRLHKVHF